MNEAQEDQIEQVIDMLTKLAAGDLEARLPLPEGREQLDVLAIALNMVAEELSASVAKQKQLSEDLAEKVRQRTAELEQKIVTIQSQQATILELSVPMLTVWKDVLVLPIIGTLDTARAELLTRNLLQEIADSGARVVIIDLTGIAVIDTAVARHFLDTIRAVTLLGAGVMLSGISPANAQHLTRLGVDLTDIECHATLFAGLRRAIDTGDH